MPLFVRMHPSIMHPTTSQLDTGAGLNLVWKELLPLEWQKLVESSRDPVLVAATKESVTIQGVILLHIRLEELCVRAWFGLVPRLAVRRLLGTSLIDHFIGGRFPQEKCLLPIHSKPVAIDHLTSTLTPMTAVSEGLEPLEGTEDDEERITLPEQVAHCRQIIPMSTAEVLVVSGSTGLSSIFKHPNHFKRILSFVSQGVVDNVTGRPFHLLMSNFQLRLGHNPCAKIHADGSCDETTGHCGSGRNGQLTKTFMTGKATSDPANRSLMCTIWQWNR